jgi:hypothetical protein
MVVKMVCVGRAEYEKNRNACGDGDVSILNHPHRIPPSSSPSQACAALVFYLQTCSSQPTHKVMVYQCLSATTLANNATTQGHGEDYFASPNRASHNFHLFPPKFSFYSK